MLKKEMYFVWLYKEILHNEQQMKISTKKFRKTIAEYHLQKFVNKCKNICLYMLIILYKIIRNHKPQNIVLSEAEELYTALIV